MGRLDEAGRSPLEALAEHYGSLPGPNPPDPSDASFEGLARAALGLVADDRKAASALDALREAGWLDPAALAAVDPAELDEVLAEARVRLASKALRPLQKLARWAAESGFEDEGADPGPTESIRDAWRTLNGVGPATADSWLLFGLGRPTYPVDRGTYRILVRHGWLDPSADYEEARSVALDLAPADPASLAELSRGMERVARDCCKPSAPRCERCPLRPFLPEGGPLDPG